MIFIFILPSNHFRNWDVQREKEREKEQLTDAQREKDHTVDRDLAKPRSRSREALIVIARNVDRDLTFVPIAIARSVDRDHDLTFAPITILPSCLSQSREALHRSQPLVEPSRLSLFLLLSIWPELMIFFSFLGFVCVSVLRNEWYYIFVWQPRKCEKMWPDLIIFFLGFVCVSVLRNEWYYIFVWQPRKCEKMWATSRKCVFYGIFKNTTKYQKIFLETFFEMQPNT